MIPFSWQGRLEFPGPGRPAADEAMRRLADWLVGKRAEEVELRENRVSFKARCGWLYPGKNFVFPVNQGEVIAENINGSLRVAYRLVFRPLVIWSLPLSAFLGLFVLAFGLTPAASLAVGGFSYVVVACGSFLTSVVAFGDVLRKCCRRDPGAG